jgi:HlyD family secretion protein
MKRIIILLVLLLVVAGGAGFWYTNSSNGNGVTFRTAPAKRGDLAATISATGTLEPEEVVDVGAQVAGMIKKFGKDPRDPKKDIDYGTPVQPDTVLAEIDASLYQSQVDQAKASLDRAEADLQQMQAKLTQCENDWQRAQNLGKGKGTISDLDYDTAQANYLTAKANVEVDKAAIGQAKATLKQAEINLGYCTIQSPVKGVIVDRRVNVGQTVVSSLNAPSLFLIAKDLTRMQIWTSVNEADIGQIRVGQPVRFTVDAYPNEKFQGQVYQIRYNATMTQNVVTYTVVVSAENKSLKLLPYLTANVEFEVSRRNNVLQVPNGALRWQPLPDQIAPDAREAASAKKSEKWDKGQGGEKAKSQESANRGTVWVKDGQHVRPLRVKVGLTDGANTEITGGDLPEGSEVVIGTVHKEETAGKTTNPFTPQMFGGKKS